MLRFIAAAIDDHDPHQEARPSQLERWANLLGVELVTDRHSKTPARDTGAAVSRRCLELGACLNIGRRATSNMFRIAPPLIVTRDQIDRAVSIFDQALGECASA